MPVLGASGGASFYGSTLEATASGAIADGDPVVLNADGTVSTVSSTAGISVQAGVKMFMMGQTSDRVYEYNLSAPYEITSAVYTGINFASNDTAPKDIRFSNDGKKLFLVGAGSDTVREFSLPIAYELDNASQASTLSVSAQDSATTGIEFNADGTQMYILGATNDAIFQYNLTTAFDLSTASYASVSADISANSTNGRELCFNNDGTKLFIADIIADSILEYALSTAYDISTLSYTTAFSVNAQEVTVEGLDFNVDGTKMFVIGATDDTVYEYDLSTGFDLSTASYSGTSISLTSQDTSAQCIIFNKSLPGTNLTEEAYLGISDGAYSDGATATIQLVGSVDDAQSGLSAGNKYFVQADGTLGLREGTPPVEAGLALSPTELLVKGSYSTVSEQQGESELLSSCPVVFNINYARLYVYYNDVTTNTPANGANFWTAIDLQGAYKVFTSANDYTEVVNVIGSGTLGTIFTGATAVNQTPIFIEVTIDGVVREWVAMTRASQRAILNFSPRELYFRDGQRLIATQHDAIAGFTPSYTTPYWSENIRYGVANSENIWIGTTSSIGGIHFKRNMRVRIKCPNDFSTLYRDHHGVLYVLDY